MVERWRFSPKWLVCGRHVTADVVSKHTGVMRDLWDILNTFFEAARRELENIGYGDGWSQSNSIGDGRRCTGADLLSTICFWLSTNALKLSVRCSII